MSYRILLAGGGTAGHVNPLLSVADVLVARGHDVVVLGTAEGLESRLVPERGHELVVIPKVPFPRRPNGYAVRFPGLWRRAQRITQQTLRHRQIDVVVGFGGYAATPAYVSARKLGVPVLVHEANALPGLANRLGARHATFVGTCFPDTPLPRATVVGMPLRREVARMDRDAARREGLKFFDFAADTPTLLVTGGSLGAKQLNDAFVSAAHEITDAGWQVLHVGGARNDVTDPGVAGYTLVDYCDRMDLALAIADASVSRAGASTVAELSALQIPTIYVPYAVGNGEQRRNAASAVRVGAARLVDNASVTPEWAQHDLIAFLNDRVSLQSMRAAAEPLAILDGAERMADATEAAAAARRNL